MSRSNTRRGQQIDGPGHGRRRSRIDQHDAGADMMQGYVPHSKPVEAQREFVRQAARKHGGADAALLVSMLLGEELTDWQVEMVDQALAAKPAPEQAATLAPVLPIAGRGARESLVIVDETAAAA